MSLYYLSGLLEFSPGCTAHRGSPLYSAQRVSANAVERRVHALLNDAKSHDPMAMKFTKTSRRSGEISPAYVADVDKSVIMRFSNHHDETEHKRNYLDV